MPEISRPSEQAAAVALLLERHSRGEVRRLCLEHGSALAAYSASLIRGRIRGTLARRALNRLREECWRQRVGLLCQEDAEFPDLLKVIPDAPLTLYYQGRLAVLGQPAVALVGARRASRYGLELAHDIARDLASRGATVVSGLALGIDGSAHRGALAADGATAAVLGSGLARVQPISHQPLALKLLNGGGLLLSEYPPGTPAAAFRFPERNRLISGSSLGVVVIEASARSGSLITARLAAEQGREVMAVPGAPGLPNSAGGNRLLKDGAGLIESARDVLEALGFEPDAAGDSHGTNPDRPKSAPRLTEELVAVLDRIDSAAADPEALALELGLAVQECMIRLTELELGGFVRRVADGYIRRPSEY